MVNIGTGHAVRLREAASALARISGFSGTLHELEGPPVPRQHPDGPPLLPYPDGCGAWQQADVRTARDRLGWRARIGLEESLADIWMEAACRM